MKQIVLLLAFLLLPGCTKQAPPPPPTDCKQPISESAIVDERQAPFPAITFVGRNRWQGRVGDDEFIAYAGHAGGEPAQGLLMLIQRRPSGRMAKCW